eukprot:54639_1
MHLGTIQMDRTHCIDHEFEINNKPLLELGPVKKWMELAEDIRKFMNIHEVREHALEVGIIYGIPLRQLNQNAFKRWIDWIRRSGAAIISMIDLVYNCLLWYLWKNRKGRSVVVTNRRTKYWALLDVLNKFYW